MGIEGLSPQTGLREPEGPVPIPKEYSQGPAPPLCWWRQTALCSKMQGPAPAPAFPKGSERRVRKGGPRTPSHLHDGTLEAHVGKNV